MEFLLDTNTISYIIDGRSTRAQKRLAGMHPSDSAGCSAVTEGELLFGAANAPSGKQAALLAAITSFLSDLSAVVPVDRAVARAYSAIRYDLKVRGKPLPDNDLWIAATAMANDYVLVSHDEAFRHVTGLKVEDWVA